MADRLSIQDQPFQKPIPTPSKKVTLEYGRKPATCLTLVARAVPDRRKERSGVMTWSGVRNPRIMRAKARATSARPIFKALLTMIPTITPMTRGPIAAVRNVMEASGGRTGANTSWQE